MSSMAIIRDFLRRNGSPSSAFPMILRTSLAACCAPCATLAGDAPCFASLKDVTPPVDGVLVMTSPAVTDQVVQECAKLGIPRVWMYRAGGKGAVSPQAVEFCEEHGIAVVPGECPYMFVAERGWFHRFHGFIKRISGAYPA